MSEVGTNLLPEQLHTSEPELDSAPEPVAVVAAVADQSAGGQLAAARQQRNMSVQQVADQLKLSPRQVAALEANQFDALPKAVIVRGFVRSYAKLLKIDAEPIVVLLPQDVTPASAQVSALRPSMATPFLESRLPLLGRQDANNNKYIWGAGLLAVLAIAFFAFQKFEHTDYLKGLLPASATSPAGNASASADGVAESASPLATDERAPAVQTTPLVQDAAGDAASKAADANIVAVKPDAEKKIAEPAASGVAATAAASLAPSVKPAIVAPAPASQPAAVSAAPSAPAVAASIDPANAMKLKFRQDSWVQIKRANGTIVTSHLARAGTEESFEVKEPLQVRLGNASGVDGQLRGASMEIQGSKDSNVVNLSVK
ncbi:helix-turn-helix domain-containing protein [Undibacterium sp.]|jgi:cytoskeleton protein RodZ|uniref:helix-turn-helix domain-containing protein n=1 Tax=Undibacterium sp. TaxID=1914977 RepID=UPI002BEFAFA7|nr:RodZ domain-containing protein [Undibacterium sp.]HTD02369.1 RodZ domain-containing protein [Undibacterium sp.]